jgi:alanyl-tRNA synthetase
MVIEREKNSNKKITRKELIKKYIEFFKKKGHAEIANSSLVPENDPTVLFTTAGMHPLVPFLLGQKHPQGKRLVNVQRCIRTGDINEVGDNFHLTFFEMLGNWSLGDYFKEEAITFTFKFLTEKLKIDKEMLAVSVFEGDKKTKVERDIESEKIWEKLGIKKERIAFLPKSNNWWEHPSKNTPCGPCTEIFYWVGDGKPKGNPKTHEKQWAEIGNDVLMAFTKIDNGKYLPASQKNIDFGGGCERILTILNGYTSVYKTDVFIPIIKKIEEVSRKKDLVNNRETRIIADHLKASIFIIADGITPSNTERGYVLRRLLRRAIVYAKKLGIENIAELVNPIFEIYSDYPNLKNKDKIIQTINEEKEKFMKTLEQGMRVFEKIAEQAKEKKKINGKDAFLLFQSYGFPLELTEEMANEKGIHVDSQGFNSELKKHQELSRTASAGQFKSGLADNSEETTKLHTAAHLMLAALRKFVKKDIQQKGSNITPERLRFDFSFDRKLTDEEVKKIEDFVNGAIEKKLEVKKQELSLEEAKEQGALGSFESKYGDKVSVYSIGKNGEISNEICAGPHVSNTSKLGEGNKHFKITEQESSGAGVRRVKAKLLG